MAPTSASDLVAGRDYPRTYREFLAWFPDDGACLDFLERVRWPAGFLCPACGLNAEPQRASRGRLLCRGCRHQATVTAGTIFDKTRTPLPVWFVAAWLITTAKNGLSAKTLERTLGVSYRTAFTLLHRFRVAMVRNVRDKLHGKVEVDETFVGGTDTGGKPGRGSAKKSIVVIAVEMLSPKGFGRIRMRLVPDASAASLVPFVCDTIDPGSVVLTDGWRGYNDLPKHGYTHRKTNLSASGDPAHIVMPAVHRVAALLKRWLLGTHQGATEPEHLQAYLEEFTFRFNRRHSRYRGLVFYRLIQQAAATGPVTVSEITHGYYPPLPQIEAVGGAN